MQFRGREYGLKGKRRGNPWTPDQAKRFEREAADLERKAESFRQRLEALGLPKKQTYRTRSDIETMEWAAKQLRVALKSGRFSGFSSHSGIVGQGHRAEERVVQWLGKHESGKLREHLQNPAGRSFQDIEEGDRVVILVHAGGVGRRAEYRERTGTAMIVTRVGYTGPITHVALDMGGRFGTPGVATPENFVRIARKGGGRRARRRPNPGKYDRDPVTRNIVGRLHVGTSDEEVERVIRSKLLKSVPKRTVDAVVRAAIRMHHKNQELYRGVMGGTVGRKRRKNPDRRSNPPDAKVGSISAWEPRFAGTHHDPATGKQTPLKRYDFDLKDTEPLISLSISPIERESGEVRYSLQAIHFTVGQYDAGSYLTPKAAAKAAKVWVKNIRAGSFEPARRIEGSPYWYSWEPLIKVGAHRSNPGASGYRQGTIEDIAYTKGGYQVTQIDGVRYATLWNAKDFPPGFFRSGSSVQYRVTGDTTPYGPYAEVLPPSGKRRSNPGLAILNPLPDHLARFAKEQQLDESEMEEFNRAIAKYCEFHGVEADDISIEEVDDSVIPEPLRDSESRHFLVGMGATEDVSYSANHKNEYRSSNKRGTPFRHETTSKPHMATDADGSAVFIINRDDAHKRMSISDWMYD